MSPASTETAGKSSSCAGTDSIAVDTGFPAESSRKAAMLMAAAANDSKREMAQKALPAAERSSRERWAAPCKEEEDRKSWRWCFIELKLSMLVTTLQLIKLLVPSFSLDEKKVAGQLHSTPSHVHIIHVQVDDSFSSAKTKQTFKLRPLESKEMSAIGMV